MDMPLFENFPPGVNWANQHYSRVGSRRRMQVEVICPDCEKSRFMGRVDINARIKKGSFTGRCIACHNLRKGERNGNWRGGRHLDTRGYAYRTVPPGHPLACMAGYHNSRILEHRFVMAEELGRALCLDEVVHHIDGVMTNNTPDNLVVLGVGEHQRIENAIRRGDMTREQVRDYAITC